MKRLVLTALLLGIAACQNTHTQPNAAPQFMRVGPVAEHDITGRCGLDLKARSGPYASAKATVFFQETGNPAAVIALEGTKRILELARATRDTLDGFPSRQEFKAKGMTARLSLRHADTDAPEGDGTHIGVLMVNKTDGWSTTIPVSGTIGCK